MPAPRGTFYRRDLPHLQRDCKPHFVTFGTHQRWQLPAPARSIVLQSCLHDHGHRYDLLVVVVMPDHVHMILTPLTDVQRCEVPPLYRLLGDIKSASAHLINEQLGRRGRVWREESFDHVLRSSESLDQKIDYILRNPVRRGLVQIPEDYPWLWRAPRPGAAGAT